MPGSSINAASMMNRIINSDCLVGLKSLPDSFVDCCVTSPPYFGLRDYGHEGQIGMEETPEAFVQRLVDVFSEVKRALKPDGTLWVNIGDSYNGSGYKEVQINSPMQMSNGGAISQKGTNVKHLKPKDLIGVPWMLAFALRSSGWYLRQDIIWYKPNPMPESVTDRCTKSHEYIFLLSKSNRYFYDNEAIKVQAIPDASIRDRDNTKLNSVPGRSKMAGLKVNDYESANKRSVWTVSTKPFSEAHFATFPEDLIVDCIKAGCPFDGLVLDPFMGAGTTALVARKLNRNFIGFELNPEYIKIAEKRLLNELGMFQ